MKHKMLVAFDGSQNAVRAVSYIAKHFAADSQVTLLSVIQEPAALCELDNPELLPFFASKESTFCALEDEKKRILKEALQKAKEQLLNAGLKEDDVKILIETNKKGIAQEIVREAKSGNYDVIVMGRRGASEVTEYFLGSISQKVVHLAKDIGTLLVS